MSRGTCRPALLSCADANNNRCPVSAQAHPFQLVDVCQDIFYRLACFVAKEDERSAGILNLHTSSAKVSRDQCNLNISGTSQLLPAAAHGMMAWTLSCSAYQLGGSLFQHSLALLCAGLDKLGLGRERHSPASNIEIALLQMAFQSSSTSGCKAKGVSHATHAACTICKHG